MGIFGRKKAPKEPDYSKMPVLPSKLAEFVQAQCGLSTDELVKLLESLGRIDDAIKVGRRRKTEGKEFAKPVGKKRYMAIAEAVKYAQERTEARRVKDQKIKELLEEVNFEELLLHQEVNDEIYPKRLSPVDIVRCTESAADKLEALDRQRMMPSRIYSPREETVLDVITLIKKNEAARVARRVANRQRAYIFGKPIEELEADYARWLRQLKGEPEPETEEEKTARLAAEESQRQEEERIAAEEAARHFGDLPDIHSLLDDVAELIRENPEAAAAIIRQWIGTAVLVEPKPA
jgi:hypothetical protein